VSQRSVRQSHRSESQGQSRPNSALSAWNPDDDTLSRALAKVLKTSPDRLQTSSKYLVRQVRNQIARGEYEFSPPRVLVIPKEAQPKLGVHGRRRFLRLTGGRSTDQYRVVYAYTTRDRLVQRAILAELRGVVQIDGDLVPGVNHHGAALKRALTLLRSGRTFVALTDISRCFERLSLRSAQTELASRGVPRYLLVFLEQLATATAMALPNREEPYLPPGSPLTPFLAALTLERLDAWAEQASIALVRYVDDIALFAGTSKDCHRDLMLLEQHLSALGLPVSKRKTLTVDASRSTFSYLGCHLGLDGFAPSATVQGDCIREAGLLFSEIAAYVPGRSRRMLAGLLVLIGVTPRSAVTGPIAQVVRHANSISKYAYEPLLRLCHGERGRRQLAYVDKVHRDAVRLLLWPWWKRWLPRLLLRRMNRVLWQRGLSSLVDLHNRGRRRRVCEDQP
jgi:hypothetical protein